MKPDNVTKEAVDILEAFLRNLRDKIYEEASQHAEIRNSYTIDIDDMNRGIHIALVTSL